MLFTIFVLGMFLILFAVLTAMFFHDGEVGNASVCIIVILIISALVGVSLIQYDFAIKQQAICEIREYEKAVYENGNWYCVNYDDEPKIEIIKE